MAELRSQEMLAGIAGAYPRSVYKRVLCDIKDLNWS